MLVKTSPGTLAGSIPAPSTKFKIKSYVRKRREPHLKSRENGSAMREVSGGVNLRRIDGRDSDHRHDAPV